MIRGTQPNLACTKDPLTRRGLPVQTATFREHSRTPVTPKVFRRPQRAHLLPPTSAC